MIQRRAKLCKCGCGKEGYIWARGYLKGHEPVKPKPIRKVTPKQREKIKENKEFYAEFIERHPTKCCDECGEPIHKPTGSNVSHIIPNQANPALYLNFKNAYLLCQTCENQWTRVDPTKMKLWPDAQKRRTELMNKHYGTLLKTKI
jgi:5-methylcytosine-specific restriction endonuclease McrA